jgi:hypothetical protein
MQMTNVYQCSIEQTSGGFSNTPKSADSNPTWSYRWCREGGSNPHDPKVGGF